MFEPEGRWGYNGGSCRGATLDKMYGLGEQILGEIKHGSVVTRRCEDEAPARRER